MCDRHRDVPEPNHHDQHRQFPNSWRPHTLASGARLSRLDARPSRRSLLSRRGTPRPPDRQTARLGINLSLRSTVENQEPRGLSQIGLYDTLGTRIKHEDACLSNLLLRGDIVPVRKPLPPALWTLFVL